MRQQGFDAQRPSISVIRGSASQLRPLRTQSPGLGALKGPSPPKNLAQRTSETSGPKGGGKMWGPVTVWDRSDPEKMHEAICETSVVSTQKKNNESSRSCEIRLQAEGSKMFQTQASAAPRMGNTPCSRAPLNSSAWAKFTPSPLPGRETGSGVVQVFRGNPVRVAMELDPEGKPLADPMRGAPCQWLLSWIPEGKPLVVFFLFFGGGGPIHETQP